MHPRALWLRATCYALIAFTLVSLSTAAARAAAPEKEKKVNRQVVRFAGYKEKVQFQGKPVMVLSVEPLEGGRPLDLVVKNHDMNKREYNPVVNTDHVNALQKGDVIKIELDDTRPRPMVTYLKKYDLKPGEENPKAYVFENSFDKGEGKQAYTAVVLSKFDEMTTVAVSQKKGKDGTTDADSEIMALLPQLKTGDVVEAEVRGGGAVPVLVSLDRYTPPQTGKFLKVSDEEVTDGQKGSAVEIEQGGKAVKALVPGKLQNKKWVSDAKVLAAVRRLKPEAEVVYRTRQDGDKLWLKQIEPAPKPAKEKLASRDHDHGADRDMDKGRDPDGADAGDRRGRRPRNSK